MIGGTSQHPDEVRDLFIRLQSGTALSRQQIRDAWPGGIGPYIEKIGGKMSRQPKTVLFRLIDHRTFKQEDDELIDPYAADRQFCASMLLLFLARESDPLASPSLSASNLDAFYHQNTEFSPNGPTAQKFEAVLDLCTRVFERAAMIKGETTGRKKFKKLDVLAVSQLFQDLLRNPDLKINSTAVDAVAQELGKGLAIFAAGKTTSGKAIRDFYDEFRKSLGDVGVRLDSRRTFSEDQKEHILRQAAGKCAVCSEGIKDGDVEYDHFPVPWRDGGRTEVSNGRAVHSKCHPRGRPVKS